MDVETTGDVAEFVTRARPFLEAEPITNNLILTATALRAGGAVVDEPNSMYAWAKDEGGALVGAAMLTPPWGFYVSPMPAPAIDALVDTLAPACPDATGVGGPAVEATAFADAWRRRTGEPYELHMEQRMYRLERVRPPVGVPGRRRTAEMTDLDVVLGWTEAFAAEVGAVAHDLRPNVELRLADGRITLWEVDREPVAFVGTNRPAVGVVRVGPVYTPPERRRRGFGGAATAAASQRALDDGAAACILYTDLANPTSNKIYQAVGYEPVGDFTDYRFLEPRSL